MQAWRQLEYGGCPRKSVQPHAGTTPAVAAMPLKQLLPVKQRFRFRNIALFLAVCPAKQYMKSSQKLYSRLNSLPVAPERFKSLLLSRTASAPGQGRFLEEPQVQTTPGPLIFQLNWLLGC